MMTRFATAADFATTDLCGEVCRTMRDLGLVPRIAIDTMARPVHVYAATLYGLLAIEVAVDPGSRNTVRLHYGTLREVGHNELLRPGREVEHWSAPGWPGAPNLRGRLQQAIRRGRVILSDALRALDDPDARAL